MAGRSASVHEFGWDQLTDEFQYDQTSDDDDEVGGWRTESRGDGATDVVTQAQHGALLEEVRQLRGVVNAVHAMLAKATVRPGRAERQPRLASCLECASSHVKCSHDEPCTRCVEFRLACSYKTSGASAEAHAPVPFSPTAASASASAAAAAAVAATTTTTTTGGAAAVANVAASDARAPTQEQRKRKRKDKSAVTTVEKRSKTP